VTRSFDGALERVKLAEKLGYESVWVTQPGSRDAMLVLSEYARVTTRVRLGTGVIPIFGRAPAAMAQSAVTLAELSAGRFVLGIGVSHKPIVEGYFGQLYVRPLQAMREYLTILQGILREGRVGFEGERYRSTFAWMGYTPPYPVPVYISALSPRMCRLAGAMADGVVLWCCPPDYVNEHIVPNVRAGAEAVGRDPSGITVVTAVPTCATDDADTARAAMRRDLFIYWTLPNYRAAIDRAGYGEAIGEFDEALASGGPDKAREAIPGAFVDALAAYGTPDDIRAKVDEYREKGTTLPAIGPFGGGAARTLEAAAGA
jgi:F420-dependent oxidoreductase-like protein